MRWTRGKTLSNLLPKRRLSSAQESLESVKLGPRSAGKSSPSLAHAIVPLTSRQVDPDRNYFMRKSYGLRSERTQAADRRNESRRNDMDSRWCVPDGVR